MKKVAIYARVSTDEQARVEEGSIKNQVEALEKYIEAENFKGHGKWGTLIDTYVDDGYSAKDLNRPALKRLLIDISRGRVNTVVFTDLSRFSRVMPHWIDLRAFFDSHHASFIAIRQQFDTSSAMGRAMLDFAIQFAQLEREMIVERVKISCHARATRGLWIGGPLPYGLDCSDRPGHLQLNVAKQIIANEILDILTEKAGYVTKAVELIREAGHSRDGGIPWDDSSLCRWVRSRALIGEVEVNTKNKGREETDLPEAERYKVVPAVWDPIVDKQKWLRANDLLDRNHAKLKVPQWKHNEFLLTGLIRCPEGTILTGASGHGRSTEKYAYYRHQKKCSCHFSSIPGDDVDKIVIRKLKEVAKSEEIVKALVAKSNSDFRSSRPNHREAMLTAKRRLQGAVTQLDLVTDQLLVARTSEEKRIWTEKSFRLQREKDQIEREIQTLEKEKHGADSGLLDETAVQHALNRFSDDFENMPFASRRGLVVSLLESVQVEKDELVLNLKNPGITLKTRSPFRPLELCESGDQKGDDQLKWGPKRNDNIKTKTPLPT